MSKITVEIDGKKCEASEGEYILNIARRNDIFIPALCYLTGCSPTLACRLCLVEADGKRVYSCNAKAKDGMVITTNNEEIQEERETIMQVYDVNHPLQCGVCDQSGECELQNYTLYMRVNEQKYAIRDTYRPIRDWGLIKYDAALCIVCEKCVTVCKDMIGDSVLKTVPRGGDALDKGLKSTMPKDSFAMWNKLQKSIIGTVNEDNSLECQDCGECISVCPVGALVSSDFQYTANAWELKKIPASNPHSSDCSLMYYEVKHGDAKNYDTKIFRVTNEHHYAPLHGGARFGFDFENRVKGKDEAAFNKVVEYIKSEADTIKFNSFITNEEALILQKIADKYNLKLVNEDAFAYQRFLESYRQTSGRSLYSGSIKDIKESNFIISVGTDIRRDAPNVGFAINNALTINKGAGLYFHPVGDTIVPTFAKNFMTIQNRVGSEEHTLAFILEFLGKTLETEVPTVEYDASQVNLPEDFDAKITKMLAKKDKFTLVVGADVYNHKRAENIAKIVGLIDKHLDVTVTIIPSQTNTLGVSQICKLNDEPGEKIVGYNEDGDIKLSALGDGDLDMPALNQQEGTFTNIDKRVVPTNAALEYRGYTLNQVANTLGIQKDYTALYTKELPVEKGYQAKDFDELPNYFDNGAVEHRGYLLEISDLDSSDEVEKVAKVENFGKEVIYLSNPINQFNYFTNKAHQLKTNGGLYVSSDFLEAKGLSEGSKVKIGDLEVEVKLDKQLSGNIPYLPTFDKDLDTKSLFKNGYRFSKIKVEGV